MDFGILNLSSGSIIANTKLTYRTSINNTQANLASAMLNAFKANPQEFQQLNIDPSGIVVANSNGSVYK